MQDLQDEQIRYLIHFSDGGSGMRHRDEPLEAGVVTNAPLTATISNAVTRP
jgi:hypothetical protein